MPKEQFTEADIKLTEKLIEGLANGNRQDKEEYISLLEESISHLENPGKNSERIVYKGK
jgi:hypothetical protein